MSSFRSSFRVLLVVAVGAIALFFTWHRGQAPAPLKVSNPPPQAASLPQAPPRAPEPAVAALPANVVETTHPARLVMSRAWTAETEPAMAAFAEWYERFRTATPDQQRALLTEGIALAQQRREKLAEWIRTDPERALAAAAPVMVRRGMPPEIVKLLEQRVAGAGELALLAALPVPGGTVPEPVFRSALVNGQEYRAYTYGRRDALPSLPDASINGIALDGALAVSDSPVRVLEAGETAESRSVTAVCPVSGIVSAVAPDAPLNVDVAAATAIEVNGRVEVLCEPGHVLQRETALTAAEGGTRTPVLAGNNLPGTSGVQGRPAQAWTHGTKKVLIIRVQFSDLMGTPVNPSDSNAPITDAYAVNKFNAANGIRDFYARGSFGKTTLSIAEPVAGDSPDVTALLTMPQTASYYAQGDGTNHYSVQLHSDARAAATAAGVAVDSYDRIGVVFSRLTSLPGSKLTYAGLGSIEAKTFWINGHFTFGVVAHEIGHNYGLQHSNLWNVTDANPISATGTSVEYGDIFDIMGDGTTFDRDFSHWNKSILQWIPDTGVTGISSGGTYRVYRFDDPAADLGNALALKLVRNRTQDYWIGLRRGTTNASLDGGAYVVWGYNDNRQGNLLDLTNPVNDTASAALAVGATFTDSVAGITLHPVLQGGSGADEWLDVQVTMQPRISWAQDNFVVDEQGGIARLTLNRESNAAGVVTVNYATSNGTAVAPADYTASSGTVTWQSGEQFPKTIIIPIVADALAEGTQTFSVTLNNVSAGAVLVNNAVATVTIADPGARDTTYTPSFVNSTVRKVLVLPDGSALLGGFFGTVQDPAFVSYTRGGITRMQEDGTVDPTFAEQGGFGAFDGVKGVMDMARQPDGKIVLIGTFSTFHGQARNRVARLNADGTLDTTFNIGTGPDDTLNAMLVQPDGKILLGGYFGTFNGVTKRMLVRLNADGSVDSGFTPPAFAGSAGDGWRVESLAMQGDGKVLVGGSFYFSGSPFKASLCRIGSSGAVDSTFNGITSGAHVAGNTVSIRSVSEIEVEMDGRILIAGNFTAYNGTSTGGFVRLTSTGALDGSINGGGNGAINTILVQPDGRIMVGGVFTVFNGTAANRVARLSSVDGAVETTFTAAGGYGDGTFTTATQLYSLALQADGKVLLGGSSAVFQGSSNSRPFGRFFGGLPGVPGRVQFSTETVAGIEGGNATLTVTRSGGSSGVVSVGYSTVAGTAGTGDYTTTSGALTWADGDTADKTITVPITADATAESAESFLVCLGQPLRNSTLLASVQRATVNVTTSFDSWRATNFTPLELADSNVSGDLGDADHDGFVNLLEFGLALDPKAANAGSTPAQAVQNVGGQNYLTLTFKRRVPALDLSYVPQTNDSLPGTWLSNAVMVGTPTSNGDGTETVTYRDNVPVTPGSRRFMRVQVTRVP